MLARLQAAKLFREKSLRSLLVSTIHDSIVADAPYEEVEVVARILNAAVESVPLLSRQCFGYAFSLPMTAEVQFGPNKADMIDVKHFGKLCLTPKYLTSYQ